MAATKRTVHAGTTCRGCNHRRSAMDISTAKMKPTRRTAVLGTQSLVSPFDPPVWQDNPPRSRFMRGPVPLQDREVHLENEEVQRELRLPVEGRRARLPWVSRDGDCLKDWRLLGWQWSFSISVALTDGEHIDLDNENLSVLRMEGIFSRYYGGAWHIQCVQQAILKNDTLKTAMGQNLCVYLGFAYVRPWSRNVRWILRAIICRCQPISRFIFHHQPIISYLSRHIFHTNKI